MKSMKNNKKKAIRYNEKMNKMTKKKQKIK